jgi:hypothetical protein
MPDTTYIHQAKAELYKLVHGQPWFKGIGIVPHGDQLVLRLNVSPGAKDSELPREIDGIPIQIVRLESYEQRGS